MISIFCQDKSHDTKKAVIGMAVKTADGWKPAGAGSFLYDVLAHNVETGWKPGKKSTYRLLDGDIPVTSTKEQSTRWRWDLVCPLCQLSVQARPENLGRLLDKALAAGVSELPLAALAASL